MDHLDRATRAPIWRMEMDRPGELVHVDVKKLGRIPKGGGWRVRGRGYPGAHAKTRQAGYAFVHSAVDAHSRLAYTEVLADEQGATAAGFWLRAAAYFASMGIVVERVLSDNGSCYRSRASPPPCAASATLAPGPTGQPPTARSIERLNRTLLAEWAYARPWSSDGQRTRALTA